MVTGLWNEIEVYCDLHEPPVKMELVNRKNTIVYECMNGNTDIIKDESLLCKGVLPLKNFEKMLEHISHMMYEAAANNEVPNLKHTEFTIGKFKYKIFEHSDKIKVKVRDTRL